MKLNINKIRIINKINIIIIIVDIRLNNEKNIIRKRGYSKFILKSNENNE